MGFKICPRPFAGKGDHLWFFMSLDGVEFTINLQSGIAHRTGTQTTWELATSRSHVVHEDDPDEYYDDPTDGEF